MNKNSCLNKARIILTITIIISIPKNEQKREKISHHLWHSRDEGNEVNRVILHSIKL